MSFSQLEIPSFLQFFFQMAYRCHSCDMGGEFEDIIRHSVENYPDILLKVRKNMLDEKTGHHIFRTENYGVIPDEVHKDGKFIQINTGKNTLKIVKPKHGKDLLSPLKKRVRIYSPCKSNMSQPIPTENRETPSTPSTCETVPKFQVKRQINFGSHSPTNIDLQIPEYHDAICQELISLIPSVVSSLQNTKHLDIFLKYTRLLSDGALPLENIAHLLFEDVVQFFSQTDTTTTMRYSTDVKKFWNIGLKIFRGKFLRFMGGPKHRGRIVEGSAHKGQYIPSTAKVNFIVPSRDVLDKTPSVVDASELTPGIISPMIEQISKLSSGNTYKVCVDGKKINAAAIGQKQGCIDLFGHEGPPTLAEKSTRLSEEAAFINDVSNFLNTQSLRDLDSIAKLPSNVKLALSDHNKRLISLLSHRIKDNREVLVGKQIALENFKKMGGFDWRKSKYLYVISALQTSIHQLNHNIKDSLRAIDQLGLACAGLNGVSPLYASGSEVSLDAQNNYICLNGDCDVQGEDPQVKQLSPAWHQLRGKAKVTGSTCNKALGLDNLKIQAQHFDQVINHTPTPPFSAAVMSAMEYGRKNEINAVGTLVSKFLLVYYRDMCFVKEGCSLIEHKPDDNFCVVSPDGSIREVSNLPMKATKPFFAIEIKCPIPGKLYATPVFYKIPRYYVAQIMSEMKALNTSKLLFICYSPESTSFHIAMFNDDLWSQMWEELVLVYGGDEPKKPTRRSSQLAGMREGIKHYIDSEVEFLAEFPSMKAASCSHVNLLNVSLGHKMHGNSQNYTMDTYSITQLSQVLYQSEKCIRESDTLYGTRATEILVFMIADLDRLQTSDLPQAVPIAYALKGYSMSVELMRRMLYDVLEACANRGLYTPIVSFDGQWSTLAMRSTTGKPLTILQLQKDVWRESKATNKSAILKHIFELNVVKSEEPLRDFVKIELSEDSSITVTMVDNAQPPMIPSKHSVLYIQTRLGTKQIKSDADMTTDSTTPTEYQDHIFNILPQDVLGNLSSDLMDDIANMNQLLTDMKHDTHQDVTVDSLETAITDLALDNMYSDDPEPMDDIPAEAEIRHDSNFTGPCDSLENAQSGMSLAKIYTDGAETRDGIHGYMEVDEELPECNVPCDQQRKINFNDANINDILAALRTDTKCKKAKWDTLDRDGFLLKCATAKDINRAFTKHALLTCYTAVENTLRNECIQFARSWQKYKLVNLWSELFGDGSKIDSGKIRRLNTLKRMCQDVVRKFPKDILNVVYAEYIFPQKLKEWRGDALIADDVKINGCNEPGAWYCQPEHMPEFNMYLFSLLDAEHILVNARAKVCSTGIPEAGISRQAWVQVARENADNKTGLSTALVEDLVDRQRCAYVLKTFCPEVENAMRHNGHIKEADFCNLMYSWYTAEDEPGICVEDRCLRRMELRKWLLSDVCFNAFPPPGLHVKGIPIVMYEGFF